MTCSPEGIRDNNELVDRYGLAAGVIAAIHTQHEVGERLEELSQALLLPLAERVVLSHVQVADLGSQLVAAEGELRAIGQVAVCAALAKRQLARRDDS